MTTDRSLAPQRGQCGAHRGGNRVAVERLHPAAHVEHGLPAGCGPHLHPAVERTPGPRMPADLPLSLQSSGNALNRNVQELRGGRRGC